MEKLMSEKKEELYKILEGWEEALPADLVPVVKDHVDAQPDSAVEEFLKKYEVAGSDWGCS